MEATIPAEKLGLVLKIGFFVFLAFIALVFFGQILLFAGILISAVVSTFAAASIANAVAVRVFERRPLSAVGLNWHPGSLRNLGMGTAAGVIAALVVLVPPLLIGAAKLEKTPESPGSFAAVVFVTVILVFGAVGEELLFRGYAFQILLGSIGRFATIIPSSVLFGWAHVANQNASILGLINTVGFGIVLGYAFVRAGDLWLPIGVHFGWNWVLPLAGVNLSGFTMGVTGYTVRWNAGEIWSGGGYGPEASILTCPVIMGLLVFLHKANVSSQRPLLLGREQEA